MTQVMAMQCMECGAEIPEDAVICPECGTMVMGSRKAARKAEKLAYEKTQIIRRPLPDDPEEDIYEEMTEEEARYQAQLEARQARAAATRRPAGTGAPQRPAAGQAAGRRPAPQQRPVQHQTAARPAAAKPSADAQAHKPSWVKKLEQVTGLSSQTLLIILMICIAVGVIGGMILGFSNKKHSGTPGVAAPVTTTDTTAMTDITTTATTVSTDLTSDTAQTTGAATTTVTTTTAPPETTTAPVTTTTRAKTQSGLPLSSVTGKWVFEDELQPENSYVFEIRDGGTATLTAFANAVYFDQMDMTYTYDSSMQVLSLHMTSGTSMAPDYLYVEQRGSNVRMYTYNTSTGVDWNDYMELHH